MLKIILSGWLVLFSFNAFTSGGHEKHKDEHKDEKSHRDHDEHDEHEKHEKEKLDGFKLNSASFKTFGIKLVSFTSPKVILPTSAIYKGLNEVNVYRLRAGLYKRIDFKTLSQTKTEIHITSPELTSGDRVVVNGVGFLRMAEIAASGGLADSHSH